MPARRPKSTPVPDVETLEVISVVTSAGGSFVSAPSPLTHQGGSATALAAAPPATPAFVDQVVDLVVGRVNIDGLASQVADKIALRLGSTVSVDKLVDSILAQHQEQLTARLFECVAEKVAACASFATGSSASQPESAPQ